MDLATLVRRYDKTRNVADGLNGQHAENRAALLELYESKTATAQEIIDALEISPSRFWQIVARARLDRVSA